MQKQTIEMKQLKQLSTPKYNNSSSQKQELHQFLRVYNSPPTLKPNEHFRWFVDPVKKVFRRKQF